MRTIGDVALVALAAWVTFSCGNAHRPSPRDRWEVTNPGNVVHRNRRWPSRLPRIPGAFDIEHYGLGSGGTLLVFRHGEALEDVWVELLRATSDAGWRYIDDRSSGRTRTLSACSPDCATRRFYIVARKRGIDGVTVIVREVALSEFVSPSFASANSWSLPLEPKCDLVQWLADQPLGESARHAPIIDIDLDRDGRLDVLLPTNGFHGVEWEAFVLRGSCAHEVGRLPGKPRADHASAVGPNGLLDLSVSVRMGEVDRPTHVEKTLRYDGGRFVELTPGKPE